MARNQGSGYGKEVMDFGNVSGWNGQDFLRGWGIARETQRLGKIR